MKVRRDCGRIIIPIITVLISAIPMATSFVFVVMMRNLNEVETPFDNASLDYQIERLS